MERMLEIKIECIKESIKFNCTQVTALLHEVSIYGNNIIKLEELLESVYKKENQIDSIVNLCLTGK